jgi:hypothetical protein
MSSAQVARQVHAAFKGSKDKLPELQELGIVTAAAIRYVVPAAFLVTESRQLLPEGDASKIVNNPVILNKAKVGGASVVEVAQLPPNDFDMVIVDEAHHYPAPTWRALIDHYPNSIRVFLTATTTYRGGYILDPPTTAQRIDPCYTLTREDAVARGYIRDIQFVQVGELHDTDAEVREASVPYMDSYAASFTLMSHVGFGDCGACPDSAARRSVPQ